MMLSLAVIPMMLGAGSAVDMVRASNARTVLQAAADSAALAGAVSGKTDATSLNKIVKNYLKANNAENVLSSVKKISQKLDNSKHSSLSPSTARWPPDSCSSPAFRTSTLAPIRKWNWAAMAWKW
ncbi:MAG: pilus assembly protein TadG-related protein [Hyphomicrobiales bacterium]